MNEKNCFLTLTYDPEHLVEDQGLEVKDWQNFAKKLRRDVGRFRFLHCGEYGDENLRPHFHACVFGQDFTEDRVPWKKNGEHQLYVSPVLEKIWGKGFVSIGSLTFDSAAYVARYVVKKATGKLAEKKYERVDGETGEVWTVPAEYATMSRNPGLGATWFDKYWKDIYPGDFVVANGKKFRPPKFYDLMLSRKDPEMLKKLKRQRMKFASDRPWDSTPERMEVKEEILERRVTERKRDVG